MVSNLFLFILSLSLADPCDFKNNPYGLRADVEECFKLLPWDKSLANSLYDNIDKYLDMAQFTEQLKSPPHPYERLKFDQKAELKRLKENSVNYRYEYEAHFELAKFYRKAHDMHQVYLPPPCFHYFYKIFPFLPKLALDANGNTIFTFTELDPDTTAIYGKFLEVDKYKGMYLSAQELKAYIGLEVTAINGMTPIEFFKEIGEHSGWSKDIGSAVNAVSASYLGMTTGTDGFFPYDALELTLLDVATEINVTVPCVHYYPAAIASVDMFKSFCESGTIPMRDSKLEAVMEKSIKDRKNNHFNFRPIVKYQMEKYGLESRDWLKEMRPEVLADYKRTPIATDPGDLYDISIYNVGSDKIGVWILQTFLLETSQVQIIYEAMLKMKEAGINKLLIDLRGNTGGYVWITNLFLTWLNKDASAFVESYWRRRRNDVADATLLGNTGNFSDYLSHYSLTNEEIIATKDILHFNEVNEKGEHFKHPVPYTAMFAIDSMYFIEDGEQKAIYTDDFFNQVFSFDREDVIVLGDGVGGSATAAFIWAVKHLMLGRAVSVGGYNGPGGYYPAGFASYSGAAVVDSDFVMSEVEKKEHNDLYPSALPHYAVVTIPWHSVMCYDNPSLLQEFREPVGDTHMFFYSRPVLGTGPDYALDYPAILEKVVDIWNSHSYPNAAWPELAKRTTVACNYDDPTSVYGHLWDNTSQSYTGPCTFLHCASLYYYDYNEGVCKAIPQSMYVEEKMSTEAIVFCALMCVFAAIAIVFCALYALGRKGKGPGHSTTKKAPQVN